MSELILPEHLKKTTLIPMPFVNKIPEMTLRQIAWGLVNSIVNDDVRTADNLLVQLMMEVDLAGKAINDDIEKRKTEKVEKKKKKKGG